LIDNASSEADPWVLKEEFPSIGLIANDKNIGFGNAADQGMGVARGDHYLLLNSDCIVPEGALRECLRALKEDSSIDILGCQMLD
ncbi:MAG: glycosyltransferase, partial [Flavobacteriales bacterium]